ncbi:MAG TPA: hypothetical protein VN698_12155 [Bacteroidia bacterium]|nr:hypothetical protein [Bacteroidia bacterium]
MKKIFNILLLSFVIQFFFSETIILFAKSYKNNITQQVDMTEKADDADDTTDNEEQKEDSGKEQTLFSNLSFQEFLSLRSFIQTKYRVLQTPRLNSIFEEVAGQPPQA